MRGLQREGWSLHSLTEHQQPGDHGSGHDGVPEIGETRIVMVQGRPITLELQENITQKPKTDRQERLKRSFLNKNAEQSSWQVRARCFLLKLDVVTITFMYFGSWIFLNTLFSVLWYFGNSEGCCGDPDMTFAHNFDFAFQTTSTIGYGSYSPDGFYANFWVVIASYSVLLLNTVFAGLLFSKFIEPVGKLCFSDVMTLSNLNGLPCLQLRVGNADGTKNLLTDVEVTLSYMFVIPYRDEHNKEHLLAQSQNVALMSNMQGELPGVWTLRHVIDEDSPLFGLSFHTHPGNFIREFRLRVCAKNDATKTMITEQTAYQVEDILIGHVFQDQIELDTKTNTIVFDFAKMNSTEPCPVWYPSS